MMRTWAMLALLAYGVAGQTQFSLQTVQTVLDMSTADTDGPLLVTQLRPSFAAFEPQYSQDDLDAPTMVFDSSLQTWMDQQLEVLSSLQSLFAPANPCGHAQAQLVLDPSQMAASRFGPALLASMLQQMELSEDDSSDEEGPLDASDSLIWEPLFASQVEEEPEEDSPAWLFRSGKVDEQLVQDSSAVSWLERDPQSAAKLGPGNPPFKPAHQPMACDLFIFVVLSLACIAVWGTLLRMCLSCSRVIKEEEARRAATTTANPLLAPLVREVSLAPELAYASEEVPSGAYYVPSGAQFVRVAYAPLHSEQ